MKIENIQLLKSPLFSYYIHSKNMLLALIIYKVNFHIFRSLFDSWKKTIKSTFHIFHCIKIKFLCFICISKYMLLWYKVCHFWTLQTLIYGWLVFNPLQELFHRKEREGFEELNFSIEGIVLHKMLIALIFLEIELWIME